MLVVEAGFLVLVAGDLKEGAHQPGAFEGKQAGVLVQVERSALRAGAGMFIAFEDGGCHAMAMQQPCQREAAGAAADDGDPGMGIHGSTD